MRWTPRGIYTLILFIFIAIHWSASLLAAPVALPPLRTDEEKIRFLLYVRENIPSLFEKAAAFDIDMFALLDDQARLQALLSELPEYSALAAKRAPFLTIQVQVKKGVTLNSVEIRPEAIEGWKSELQTTLRQVQVSGSADLETSVVRETARLMQELKGGSSQGLVTGLIQALPKDARAQVFRAASVEEKLRLLSELLPDPVPQGFRASYGLSAGASKAEALARAQELIVREKRITALSELHVILQDPNQAFPKTILEAESRLQNLGSGDLQFFADKDALTPRIDKLQSAVKGAGGTLNPKDLTIAVRDDIANYASRTEVVAQKVSGGLRLVEVPPHMAIFRGCTGGDCSTQMSFAYPNDPHERVFFIYGEDGTLKGYAAGTLVESNGENAFHLITINGPRVSGPDATLVIAALEREKEKLGATRLMLPPPSRHQALINFAPIKESFVQATQGGQAEPIRYKDPKVREAIEEFISDYNKAHYDHMKSNPWAIAYRPPETLASTLETTAVASPRSAFNPSRAITRGEYWELAIESHMSQRSKLTLRILEQAGITDKDFKSVLSTLKNEHGLTLAQYEESVRDAFRENGLDPEILERKPHWTFQGAMQASDLAAPGNQDRVVELFKFQSRYYENLSGSAENFLKKNPDALWQNERLQTYVLSLLKGETDKEAIIGVKIFKAADPNRAPVAFRDRLLPFLISPSSKVKIRTTELVGKFAQQRPSETLALMGLLSDPDTEVVRRALIGLPKGTQAIPEIAQEIERAVIRVLGNESTVSHVTVDLVAKYELKSDAIRQALITLAHNGVFQTKSTAALAFVRQFPDDFSDLKVLAEALANLPKELQQTAWAERAALRVLTSTSDEIAQQGRRYIGYNNLTAGKNIPLEEWIAALDQVPDPNSRAQILKIISKYEGNKSVLFDVFARSLNDPAQAVKIAAFRQLVQHFPDDPRIPALAESIASDPWIARQLPALVKSGSTLKTCFTATMERAIQAATQRKGAGL